MAEKTTVILEALMNVSDVESKIGRIQKGLKELNIPKDIAANLTDGLSKLGPLLKDYKKQLKDGFSTQKDVNNFNTLGRKIDEVFDGIDDEIKKVNSKEIRLNIDLTDIKKARADVAKSGKDLENLINSTFSKIGDDLKKKNPNFDLTFLRQGAVAPALKPIGKELVEAFNTRDIEKYQAAYEKLRQTLNSMSNSSKTKQNIAQLMGLNEKSIGDVDKVKSKVEEFLKILRISDRDYGSFKNTTAGLEEADRALDALLQDAQTRGENTFSGIANGIDNTKKTMRGLTDETSNYGRSMATAADQVRDLQQSTQYFFSLRNMLNLLKRGIDDAVQSVKELDAAMTETAVVTDYKVSDLWGMLPQYTQLANQLGATTQGAYETMTLYFQQGLNQQQAFEVGAETMKMARIAGLDYAETTDMMTAALRGFNMEINETSAKRVNDVYSELAAITASDTEELGTAMQRTASIAHSAGASFEGATAFLAQAIETTREPAENIGTAMKTIVARFQEMKKNPLEISEVDGEEVDYNKIDAALKTIGVDLKDTNGQFRDWDKVMLDISAKWNTLSQSQQRYIATVAAGSRQQSRFIAMVSNYDRTMQLMEAANNSAGASDEQFGKTMDSLESKLNKLHNAWELFTMGIANNGMIKMAVDGLTGLLTVTNKLINAFSLGFGPLKSFLSIFTAFTGLKVAGRVANSLIGGLGGLVDPQSTFKDGLKTGLFGQGKTNVQAQAITTPIVSSLNRISQQIAQIKNGGINNKGQSGSEIKNTSKQEYANIKAQFGKLSDKEGFKMSDASNLFGQLDQKHQLSMFNNSPGTKSAMQKASMTWFNSKGLSKELTHEGELYINSIYKGMKKGQIPVDKGIELIGKPQKWGAYFGTETALAYSKSFIQESKSSMEASRQKAHEYAMLGVGLNPEDYKVGSKELKNLLKDEGNKQLKADYATLYKGWKDDFDKEGGHRDAKGKVSDLGRLANDIGSIGDKFTQAGYGITTFGNALSQLGGPIGAIGTGISAFGGAISSMGMMVSGATSLITVFSEGIQVAGTSIAISGGTIAAIAAPLAAAAAAFLMVRAHLKKVKEAGEEVTKTFEETNKAASDNVAKLKSYQSEFATLSKGVDANGNNVNLDDSQYQRYLEIVDEIATINPDIVEGYNAQGHAIINNNKALEETLKRQQKIKQEALDTYTSEASLQKLINARNVDANYSGTKSQTRQRGIGYGQYGFGSQARLATTAGGMASDVFNIADQLRLTTTKDAFGNKLKVDANMLQKYGIESMDALISGEEQAVKNFIKHRDEIQAELTNSGFKLSDSLIKGFDKLNKDQKAFDEAIQPVYDNLLASVSNSPFYEELGSEFKSGIALGLKDIASQDLNASEMQDQAQLLVQEFENLTRKGGEYATAMEDVEKAQDKFASSLDASQYAKDTEAALENLNSLLKQYEGNTTAYGQAVSEYLTNQIEQIKRFTEEGTLSVTDGLNTMTTEIAAAEGAYEAFQEATKSDFSTAKESMKSIFDEVTKETDGKQLHLEDKGDKTMWTAAEALFGTDAIADKGAEEVKKMFDRIEPMLQDGRAGFEAFWMDALAHEDELKKIPGVTVDAKKGILEWDENANPDVFHEIAVALGESDDFLTSMLNSGRQFADINFANVKDVRKALATDDAAIKGTGKGQGNLYVKDDYIKGAMRDADIVTPKDQKDMLAELKKNGIKVIPGAGSITQKDFKNLGISDLASLIKTFGDTGQFNRSEIEEYAQRLPEYSEGKFDTLYKDYLDSQEHPELPSINNIDSNVSSILSLIAHERGQLTQEDKDALSQAKKDVYGERGVSDTIAQQFSKGLNKNGEKLSKDEYKLTKDQLKEEAKSYDKAAEFYNNVAEKAKEAGDSIAEAEARQTADDYTKLAQDTRDYRKEGIRKRKEERRKEEDKKNAPTPGMDSSSTTQEKNYKREKGILEKRNKEREAINQAYLNSEQVATAKTAKEAQKLQYNRQIYEQNARNTTPPIKPVEAQGEGAIQRALTFGLGDLKGTGEDAVTNIARFAADKVKQFNEDADAAVNDAIQKNQFGGSTSLKERLQDKLQKESEGIDITDYLTPNGLFSSSLPQKIQEYLTPLSETLSGDNITIPDPNTGFVQKVKTSAEKLGQALKDGWDALNGNNVEPPSPSKKTVKSINEGGQTVVNAANEAINGSKSKIEVDDTQVEEADTKVEDLTSKVNEGGTYNLEVKGQQDITKSAAAAQKLTKVTGKENKIKVTADKVDTSSVKQAKSDIAGTEAKLPVTAKDKTASGIRDIKNKIKNDSVTLNVEAKPKGSTNFTVTVKSDARGQNNKITPVSLPSFGSAARGTNGTVGPKNKGGLTLTGEEGYEVAWIPSENRSMILGANGPQMINLPSEAVVWTHEQSKKILKQKSIAAGSLGDGSTGSVHFSPSSSNNNTNNNTPILPQKTIDSIQEGAKKTDKAAEKVINVTGRVSVWWDNMARRLDNTQHKADQNQTKLQLILKTVGTTYEQAAKLNATYIAEQKRIISLANKEIKQANSELKVLDKGKKASAADRKAVRRNNPRLNTVHFTYDIGKGKNKKSRKGKTKTGKYIVKDGEDYVINQKEIAKVAKKNRSKAKAIAEAVGKVLDETEKKRQQAEDLRAKAQEAIANSLEEIYQTFYTLDKAINNVYLIGQKLEHISSLQSAIDSSIEKEFTKAGAGFTPYDDAEAWTTGLQRVQDALNFSAGTLIATAKGNYANIDATYKELTDALNLDTYKERFESWQQTEDYKKMTPEQIQNQSMYQEYNAAKELFKLLQDSGYDSTNFDFGEALQILNEKNYGSPTYEKMKELLERIRDKQNNYVDSINSSNEAVAKIYSTLQEYREYVAEFENDLISGLEEEAAAEIDKLDKLDKSLSKAMKDLLDEVKRKLDERRKKEDNQRTESELSQKQQRLAMLRADTAGGHAVEIAQLEKEIADSRRDYQRSLEDQLIEKLQNQADEAEKQRQKQIELLEAQKEIADKTGTNLEQVRKWMENPLDYREEIRKAWLANKNYDEVGENEQIKLEREFDEAWLKFYSYRETGIPDLENMIATIDDSKTGFSIAHMEELLASIVQKGITGTGRAIRGETNEGFKAYETAKINAENSYLALTKAQAEYEANQKTISDNSAKVGTYTAQINDLDKQIKKLESSKATIVSGMSKKEKAKAKAKNEKIQKQLEKLLKRREGLSEARDKALEKSDRAKSETETDYQTYQQALEFYRQAMEEVYTKYEDLHLADDGYEPPQLTTGSPDEKVVAGPTDKVDASAITAKATQAEEEKIKKQNYNNRLAAIKKKGTISKGALTGAVTAGGKIGKTPTQVFNDIKKQKGISWNEILTAAKAAGYTNKKLHKMFSNPSKAFQDSFKKIYKATFASGGLADFTGPAWLDGTSSKPELVLNAQDTKNFMALKDVLSHVMSSADNLAAASGDAIFEINVNVDHLNNDYDVDRVVERVKKKIVQDSSYRNVTQVRKFR